MILTTHVLDTAAGTPAGGVEIILYAIDGATRTVLGSAITNADGRTDAPLAENLIAGHYELTFMVATYFEARSVGAFYDEIAIRFRIDQSSRSYHVPLLFSPWGYSTYRGT
jgi:5-hydroxyisourate hydrolase